MYEVSPSFFLFMKEPTQKLWGFHFGASQWASVAVYLGREWEKAAESFLGGRFMTQKKYPREERKTQVCAPTSTQRYEMGWLSPHTQREAFPSFFLRELGFPSLSQLRPSLPPQNWPL